MTILAQETYHAPAVMSDWLIELTAHSGLGAPADLRVFDADCGSGLLGVALQTRGLQHIVGADLSAEMVAQAEKTGAYYHALYGDIDLNEPLPTPLAAYPEDAAGDGSLPTRHQSALLQQGWHLEKRGEAEYCLQALPETQTGSC